MIEKLKDLLIKIVEERPEQFSGLGIILYNDINHLPVSPLRQEDYLKLLPVKNFDLIVKYLLEISPQNSFLHDGFHLLSSEFYLTHTCQYFSTPIVKKAPIEYNYGSRYRTALYGSYLNSVTACGVIGSDFETALFIKGVKVVI